MDKELQKPIRARIRAKEMNWALTRGLYILLNESGSKEAFIGNIQAHIKKCNEIAKEVLLS